MYAVFPVHDGTREQNSSPSFDYAMAISVKILKFC